MWQATKPECSHHADSLYESTAAAARSAAMQSAAAGGDGTGSLLLALNATQGGAARIDSVDPKLCPGAEGKRRILFNPRLVRDLGGSGLKVERIEFRDAWWA